MRVDRQAGLLRGFINWPPVAVAHQNVLRRNRDCDYLFMYTNATNLRRTGKRILRRYRHGESEARVARQPLGQVVIVRRAGEDDALFDTRLSTSDRKRGQTVQQ